MSNPIITGIQVAYYNVCYRKLWLFTRSISMEHTSELVKIGKIIHENSYSRKRREINLEGIKIDLLEAKRGVIHEVKKSKAIEKSHVWQLKYYLYYFKEIGIDIDGIIDYPKIRRRERIILTQDDEEEIKKMLFNIQKIVEEVNPPSIINKPYCKKCSYYEFCYC
ncbi:MAG: CRISPR-associated protein Cas4 [Hydrogenothermaceae bacterium]